MFKVNNSQNSFKYKLYFYSVLVASGDYISGNPTIYNKWLYFIYLMYTKIIHIVRKIKEELIKKRYIGNKKLLIEILEKQNELERLITK